MRSFMKTILSAAKVWTNGRIKESVSDWNQNDSNADNYIKNRTHWEEEEKITVFANEIKLTFTPDDGGASWVQTPFPLTLTAGKTYNITWDGNEYSLEAYYDDGIILGNSKIWWNNEYSEEYANPPFVINSQWIGIYNPPTNETHTVSISTSGINIHQLDFKYLPSNVAKIEQVEELFNENAKLIAENAEQIEENRINLLTYEEGRNIIPISTVGQLRFLGNKFIISHGTTTGNIRYNAYSSDGIHWYQGAFRRSSYGSKILAYGNSKYIAISPRLYSYNYTNYLDYSTDGISWSRGSLPVEAYWIDITYANDQFVAIGRDPSVSGKVYIITSSDGINWNLQNTLTNFDLNPRRIFYIEGKVFILGGSKYYFSSDFKYWGSNIIDAEFDGLIIYGDMAYGNNCYVVTGLTNAGVYGNYYWYSTNGGSSWTRKIFDLFSESYNTYIYFANGTFYAWQSNSPFYYYTSTNMSAWTVGKVPLNGISNIAYGNGVFVVNYGTKTATSTDGINWDSDTIALIQNEENKTNEVRDLLLNEHIIPLPETAEANQAIIVKKADSNGLITATETATVLYKDKGNEYLILTDKGNGYEYGIVMLNGSLSSKCLPSHITITTLPNKTDYLAGEIFDPTGMVVTLTRQDGSEEIIDDYTYPTTALESGISSVIITYTEFGQTYKTTLKEAYLPSLLVDFNYTDNNDGTYTLTSWKQTLNGVSNTDLIIPDRSFIKI